MWSLPPLLLVIDRVVLWIALLLVIDMVVLKNSAPCHRQGGSLITLLLVLDKMGFYRVCSLS